MTAPRIIALTGRARAGKSAAAKHLTEYCGFREVSFARPLKEMALRINPPVQAVDRHEMRYLEEVVGVLGWERAKDEFPEVRRFLQRLGTQGLRAVDDNFWVNIALHEVHRSVRDGCDKIVFADTRFPNEAEALTALSPRTTVVRITRPGLPNLRGDHSSEAGLPDAMIDETITNDGSLVALGWAIALHARRF